MVFDGLFKSYFRELELVTFKRKKKKLITSGYDIRLVSTILIFIHLTSYILYDKTVLFQKFCSLRIFSFLPAICS